MADNIKEKAGLISRNQGGGQAPLGDPCMETDTENGKQTQPKDQTPEPPRKETETPVKQGECGWTTKDEEKWRELQLLEEQTRDDMNELKEHIKKMLDYSKTQKNMNLVIRKGLNKLVDTYEALSLLALKRKTVQLKLKERMKEAFKGPSPTKEKGSSKRVRMSDEEHEDFTDSTDATYKDSDSTSGAAGMWRLQTSNRERKKLKKEEREEKRGVAKDLRRRQDEARKKEAEENKIQQEAKRKQEETRRTNRHKESNRPLRRMDRRPDALVIRASESLSYSDILQKLRAQVKPEESGTELTAIRKTRKGDVLLEVIAGSKINEDFRKAVTEAVGEANVAKELSPRTSLEVRDLDELATKEEVRTAIESTLGGARNDMNVTILAPNTRNQRLAIIELSMRDAEPILKTGRTSQWPPSIKGTSPDQLKALQQQRGNSKIVVIELLVVNLQNCEYKPEMGVNSKTKNLEFARCCSVFNWQRSTVNVIGRDKPL
ncbi:hypothetical protein GE061_002700 [Apolygus lucorum]|uniref:Uncharacterized protein n=1 Tax=Apolygus lucorum TaxID=248454 RepID=A0A8S9X779_APOLU|nr:hypothetical protein GE061_002700 [Apolygus lucorum]